jgi:hypothetical protein
VAVGLKTGDEQRGRCDAREPGARHDKLPVGLQDEGGDRISNDRRNPVRAEIDADLAPDPEGVVQHSMGVVACQDRVLDVYPLNGVAGDDQLPIGLLDKGGCPVTAPKVGADRAVDPKRRIKLTMREVAYQ